MVDVPNLKSVFYEPDCWSNELNLLPRLIPPPSRSFYLVTRELARFVSSYYDVLQHSHEKKKRRHERQRTGSNSGNSEFGIRNELLVRSFGPNKSKMQQSHIG